MPAAVLTTFLVNGLCFNSWSDLLLMIFTTVLIIAAGLAFYKWCNRGWQQQLEDDAEVNETSESHAGYLPQFHPKKLYSSRRISSESYIAELSARYNDCSLCEVVILIFGCRLDISKEIHWLMTHLMALETS